MLVMNIMTRNPGSIPEDTSLHDAAEQMKKNDFGFLPIKHESKIVGVITDRDIVVRGLAKGLDPNRTKVKEIMTKEFHYCHEDDDLKDAAKLMGEKKINRLAVYDRKNQFSGVISLGDIARKSKDLTLCGKLIEAIHQI